jgi:hypothetical protein
MGFNPSLNIIQFNQIPSSIIGSSGPFSGCMNIQNILFPQNLNCQYFDDIDFLSFTNGTNLFQFGSWCNLPSDLPSSDSSSQGLSALEIIVIVMGLVIGILIIGNVICYLNYKKEHHVVDQNLRVPLPSEY